jgi:hypothetical protein
MVSVRSRHNPVVVWGQWCIWREDNEGRTKRTGEQWDLQIHFILQTWIHQVCHSKTKSSMQFLLYHQINLFKSIGALQSHLILYKNACSNNGLMKRFCKRASPPTARKGAVKLSFSCIIASSVLQICKQTDDTVHSKWASKREWLFFISLGGDISLANCSACYGKLTISWNRNDFPMKFQKKLNSQFTVTPGEYSPYCRTKWKLHQPHGAFTHDLSQC